MRIAQRLYEGIDIGGETTGLITYMRTDGVSIAPEAVTQVRKVIGEDYGRIMFRILRASTRPRPRTRRKRTKPFARPICRAARLH
jgi:DNA topoisomerase IA